MLKPASASCLLAQHADIDQDPEDEAWTQLIEGLDVERPDRRVQFASNVELRDTMSITSKDPIKTHIVDEIPTVAAQRK